MTEGHSGERLWEMGGLKAGGSGWRCGLGNHVRPDWKQLKLREHVGSGRGAGGKQGGLKVGFGGATLL